jgi:hypothetical protein
MAVTTSSNDPRQPLTLGDFDPRSGSLVERALFNHRGWVLLLCLLVTLLLGWQATRLQLAASFEKTIPTQHPWVQNFLARQSQLTGLGNAVRVAVANPKGTIYDAAYLDTLRALNDAVFLLPGVDRMQMRSLWTPATRWVGVTEEGLEGGPVIPDGYDGSARSLQQLQANVARSQQLGLLVARDERSCVIHVPLLAQDAQGRPLDYGALSRQLEDLRQRFEARGVTIHITGFAKIVGDLIDGVRAVLMFFALAVAIASAMVYGYTRCVRSTVLVVLASLVAVVWQLGLLPALGFALDPYSILVPFLVFAIGMSHGAQKMNGIMQDVGRGAHKWVAARYTFRRLFLAGLTALLADAVGFAVLLADRHPRHPGAGHRRQLRRGGADLHQPDPAAGAAVVHRRQRARRRTQPARRERRLDGHERSGWGALEALHAAALCRRGGGRGGGAGCRPALRSARGWQIGDLDPGAPELRPTAATTATWPTSWPTTAPAATCWR